MALKIQDGSNDKGFFSIIPHYITNHSTANDQALYLQMKRFAGEGEDGVCFATEQTLMKKLGIGKKAYDKSIGYLLKRNWIEYTGLTQGKTRPIKTYRIVDIWQENMAHYKEISAESNISFRGDKSQKEGDTSQKQHKISVESNVEEEPVKEEPLRRERATQTLERLSFFENENQQLEIVAELVSKGVPEPLASSEIKKFIAYWTEPSQSGLKVRWQGEKFFDVKRRLTTWFSRIQSFSPQGRGKQPIKSIQTF